jgi:hypothetical protein
MALARCKECGVQHDRTTVIYSGRAYYPVGHPNSGVVCGTKRCSNAAQIWLDTEEEKMYEKGLRVFDFKSNVAKVRLDDPRSAPL